MGVVFRQGFKSSIIAYLGVIIGAFNLLWLYPKFLSKEQIGLTRVFIDIALVMAALAQIGTTNISDRFFPYFKDEDKKHQGFFLFLIFYPLIGFFIMTALFLFSENLWIKAYKSHSSLLLNYIKEILPLAFFIMYMNILEAYSRVHFRIVIPTFIREVFLRVFMTVIIVLYYLKFIDLDGLIYLIVLSYLMAIVLLVAYLKNLKKLFLTAGTVFQNKSFIKEMIIFGLIIFLGGASGMLATKIDIIMLSFMKDLGNAGIYTIAFFIGTIIEIPRRMISQITTPLISTAWKNNDIKELEAIYYKTSLNQFIIGMLLFLLIWLNVDNILGLIPHSEIYQEGKYVILIIGLGRITDMITGVNTEIILNSPFYKFNFLLIILSSLLLILLNYLLIPIWGMNGAALSIFIIMLVFNLIKYLFLLIKFKIQPFNKNHLLVILICALIYGIVYILPELTQDTLLIKVVSIVINSLIIMTLFVGLTYILKVSEDFNNLMKIFFERIKINLKK